MKTNHVVKGFKASAVIAGLKKESALDLALIFSEKDATAAGVFTKCKVKAAPVLLSLENIQKGRIRAIVANAGTANACTGVQGLADARETASLVAGELGIKQEEVLVGSTGVIGQPLNMDLVRQAIPKLVQNLSPEGIPSASQAIMTTDSFPKISLFEGQAGGKPYRILGIAKGAGMIMPNMATMLNFILTDLHIDEEALRGALQSSVETTFNRITVDGDTSTNDMSVVLANGMAQNDPLNRADLESFTSGLRQVMQALAHMMVQDGEGATKVIQVHVKGAASASDATQAARTVANSNLVKTAFYGQDANWGRIMAALGRADIMMKEDVVDIWIDDVQLVSAGLGKGEESEASATERMAEKEVTLTIDLHQGAYQDRFLTCDLTHEYVTINAHYRT